MYCVVNLLYEGFASLLAYCWGMTDLGPRRYIVGLLGSGAGLAISCMGGGGFQTRVVALVRYSIHCFNVGSVS